MAQKTSIEWCDVSWNPVSGCSKVSTGCKNCYAETLSLRYGQTKGPWTARNAAENVLLKPHKLREPLSGAKAWQGLGAAAAAAGKTEGKLVFVNSMSDLFHEQIPDEYIAEAFAVMAMAQRHTFQILTKRPERMRDWFARGGEWISRCGTVRNQFDFAGYADRLGDPMSRLFEWPLPNVWLGVSIENRKWVGRADVLRQTPAAVRFISAEPLLGPLISHGGFFARGDDGLYHQDWPDGYIGDQLNLTGIDWLIAGGESGPNFRPMDLQWMRGLRDECAASDTAFFAKQIASSRPGVDPPGDLLIREFPAVAR